MQGVCVHAREVVVMWAWRLGVGWGVEGGGGALSASPKSRKLHKADLERRGRLVSGDSHPCEIRSSTEHIESSQKSMI